MHGTGKGLTMSRLKDWTFQSWKEANKYLKIDSSKTILTCDICIKWKSKLSGTNSFMNGCINLKSSAVNEHSQNKLHKRALRLEEEEPAKLENRMCCIVQVRLSEDVPIVQAVGNMTKLKEEDKNL